MADQILDEVREFLDDLGTDLTNMHVKAMQYLNTPFDHAATEALASIPAGLLERAQALAAKIDEQEDGDDDEPKAKPAAKKAATRRRSTSH